MQVKYVINKQRIQAPKSNKTRDKTDVFIMGSNGEYNTRLNPVNRHSEYGFALRMAYKLNRKPNGIKGYHSPQFLK